jgi:hypothetical protein
VVGRAAHDDDLAHRRGQARLESHRQRQVRQRAERDECHLAGPLQHGAGDELGSPTEQPAARRWRPAKGAAQAVLAVDLRVRVARRPHQRAARSGRDRNVGPPADLEYPERIQRGLLGAGIPENRRDRQHVQLRRAQREQQRHRIVHAGVGVDQDAQRHAVDPGAGYRRV